MIPQEKLIAELRRKLKGNQIARRLCGRYHENPEKLIDETPIRFEPLDVSAKTVDGEIILNDKLLGGKTRDMMRYLVHELTHVNQQKHNKVKELSNSEDYLEDDNEEEAFKTQVDYMEEVYSPEEIQTYLEGLVRHHGLTGKERIRKIKELAR